MTTANIRKGIAKRCVAGLIFLCLWVMVPGAWAAYEVNQNNITANVLTSTPTRWTGDLTVQWTGPSMTGNDVLNGYIYKWNNSSSLLNDTAFNANLGFRDGIVETIVNPPNVTKSAADLASLDSGDLLYLHIKTWYLDVTTTGSPAYSSDVVYGPFLIDNVAPAGTIRIVDASGTNDVTSTSDTIVYLKLAASKDPVTMYLSETSTKPATGVAFNVDAVYQLGNTVPSPPDKTIYAWFEDVVGNVSAAPATDSFTLLAPINISPNSVTLDLGTGATQVFRVEGTSATYTWTIINQVPVTQGATVAQFSGASSGTNSVTVQGLAKGTFQLQADPTPANPNSGDELTSGTITVVQSTRTNSIVLNTGWNSVSFNALPAAEGRTLSAFFGANAALVQQIKTQNLSATNNSTTGGVNWIGTLTLMDKIADGTMFKIKVSSGFTLDVTGLPIDQTAPITLSNGWTWAAYLPNTSMNWDAAVTGIMGTLLQIKSQTQSRTKSGSSFVGDMTTMAPGKGYAIRTNATGTLNYPAP